MTIEKRLSAVVVGCGAVGSLYDENRRDGDPRSHAGAYSRNLSVRLAAGADIDPERRRKFSSMWGLPTYADYSRMFEREKPTIVSICTWPESHAEITLSAVKSGARAIFCEKPLADTIENGRQLVETCDSHNVCLIVNHSRRWDVEHQQIRDFLCKGQLGTLQHATVHYARGISNTGSHLVDLLRFFFGEVDWVRAFDRLKEKDAEPSLDGYIMMKNGIGCSIAGCPRGHYDIFDWDIIGTGGRLRIEDMGRKTRLWRPAPNPGWPGRQMLIEAASPFVPGLTGMMAGAVNNVVGCLTKHEKPLDTGQDGLAALETITALKQSAVSEGKRVNLPLGQ